jgi:U3 small nucleolar RNA-associated protein 14
VKAGWGDWAGPGQTGLSRRTLLRRDSLLQMAQAEDEEKRRLRKDNKMYNVVLSDRRVKTASKYKVAAIPHPFTTREEYELSMKMPLGGKFSPSRGILPVIMYMCISM